MTRRLLLSWMLLLALASTGVCQTKAAPVGADKPTITIVFPSTDEVFSDLKLAISTLAEDEKSYDTLKGTIEVFLEGVETNSPGGVRAYLSPAGGLLYVLSLPCKDDKTFKKLLQNLWDLDVKSAPAPTPQLDRLVPKPIKAKLPGLKLTPTERLLYKGLFDGFLRYEPGAAAPGVKVAGGGQVHLGRELVDIRAAKGSVSGGLLHGYDLVIKLDGQAQPMDKRAQAFQRIKTELLAALVKGEAEKEQVFAYRKSLTEFQVAEMERFFVESSELLLGWTLSEKDNAGVIEIDILPLPATPLEQSAGMLDQSPDEYAGASREGAVLSLSSNFPIDALRQQHAKAIIAAQRDKLKNEVENDAALTDDQKKIDRDLIDTTFAAFDGIVGTGLLNGFGRSWSNTDGTFTSVGAGTVPNGADFVAILQKLAMRGGANQVTMNVETEADVEIHKITAPSLATNYPELFGKDGVVYVGTSAKSVWIAAGDKSLEKLKESIQEVRKAGAKPGPTLDLFVKVGAWVDLLDRLRDKTPAKPAPAVAGAAAAPRPTKSLLSGLDVKKLANAAFKHGKDTLSINVSRQDKTVKTHVRLDEGMIRFGGKVIARFVEENLSN